MLKDTTLSDIQTEKDKIKKYCEWQSDLAQNLLGNVALKLLGKVQFKACSEGRKPWLWFLNGSRGSQWISSDGENDSEQRG